VAVSGCTAAGGAIFATIEQEVPTEISNLPDTTTVRNVVGLPTGDGFIAVAPSLFLGSQSVAGSNAALVWKGVASGLAEGATCRGAVVVDGRLYAVFGASGASASLYRAALPAGLAAEAEPALTFEAVPWDVGGQTPEDLMLVNDQLFVATRQPSALLSYGLVHLDTGTDAATSLVPAGTLLAAPPADGAFHGGAYWFVAGGKLLTGPAGGPLAISAEPAVEATTVFGGIHADSTSARLHLSTRSGRLLYREGTTWVTSDALVIPGETDAMIFTDFLSLPNGSVYVGSESRGFYLLTDGILAQTTLDAARRPSRTIGELYSGTIRRLVHEGNVVFLLTAGAGLWHQVLAEDLDLTSWTWE
jgi:hypothetical protein